MGRRLVAICALAIALICLPVPFHTPVIAEFYDHCQLDASGLTNLSVATELGNISLDEIGPHHIWLSSSEGDARDPILYDRRTDNLNFDGLYRLSLNGKHWFFRFNGQTFIEETGRTGLYNVEWAGDQTPSTGGRFELALMDNPQVESGSPQFVTVGDSITWWNDGRYLRCSLLNQGLKATFLGSRVDAFGFNHEGEGGDSTYEILARMEYIPASDNYFLLIGANDVVNSANTVIYIDQIASKLADKKPGATVFISTLLPRFDEFKESNEAINFGLRRHVFSCEPQCKLVDVAAKLELLPNWRAMLNQDGLHPNPAGYRVLGDTIASEIEHLRSVGDQAQTISP